MSHGGRRQGSGKKAIAGKFRSTCREIVESEKVQKLFRDTAETDAHFALKLAEHGWGRPPQSLDIKVAGDSDQPIVHEVTMPGGAPLSASVAGLPASSSAIDGER